MLLRFLGLLKPPEDSADRPWIGFLLRAFRAFVVFQSWITAKGRRREEEISFVLKFEGLDLPPASLEVAKSAEREFFDCLCALCVLCGENYFVLASMKSAEGVLAKKTGLVGLRYSVRVSPWRFVSAEFG